MTTPSPDVYHQLIDSIEGLREVTRENAVSIDKLSKAVYAESDARNKKVRQLARLSAAVALGTAVLIGGMALNAYNTTRTAEVSRDVQKTNDLLLKSTTDLNNTQRQTVFVIAICQRQNPLPQNPTPAEVMEGTTKLKACVTSYFPNFDLPPKVGG